MGAFLGVLILSVMTAALAPFAAARYGLIIEPRFIDTGELALLASVVAVGVLASLVPA